MPQYVDSTYYTLENGLQSLPDALVSELENCPYVSLRNGCRVQRIEQFERGQLHVTFQDDASVAVLDNPIVEEHASISSPKHEVFDIVVLAIPAEALEEVEGVPAMHRHLWKSVSRNRLIRCYVKFDTPLELYDKAVVSSAHHRKKTNRNGKCKDTGKCKAKCRSRRKYGGRSVAVVQQRAGSRTRARMRTTTKGVAVSTQNCCKSTQITEMMHSPSINIRNVSDLSNPSIRSSVLHKCTTTQDPHWVQLSYCDHLHADHLLHMFQLPRGLNHFRKCVGDTMGKAWSTFRNKDIDLHYWKCGTHSWKPQLPADDHYHRCLQPDSKLPLFVVGSSMSHYGHWMEGALETVNDAYKKCWRWAVEWLDRGNRRCSSRSIRNSNRYACPRAIIHVNNVTGQTAQQRTSSGSGSVLKNRPAPTNAEVFLHHKCEHANTFHTMEDVRRNGWVVLDGYVYDVTDIEPVHPGGTKLISNVKGSDISASYHRIGHSSSARAWVERYCKGKLKSDSKQT